MPDTPGQDPAEAVAGYIGDHRVLVVLDNCEHLAGETAKLAESLLGACPALAVLATSREGLGVGGEVNWRVPPLSLPTTGTAATAAELASSAAVTLFEQRAQLVRPSFRVTDDNAAKVASICQRLDGWSCSAGWRTSHCCRSTMRTPTRATSYSPPSGSTPPNGWPRRAKWTRSELVRLLHDQVGVPPAAETMALYRRLLAAQ